MYPRLVITGAQRSGTRYVATVLRRAGLNATHEGNEPGTGWRTHDPREGPRCDVDIDVCWHSAWWLDTTLAASTVVHLVRAPLASIASSVVRRTFYRPRPSGRWAMDRLPTIAEGSNIERSARYWVLWNEMIEPHANWRVRVEDIGTGELACLLEEAGIDYDLNALAAAVADTATNVNANAKRRPLRWPDLPEPLRSMAQRAAIRYGYRDVAADEDR